MKYLKILAILVFSSVISFYACNDKTKSSQKETANPSEVTNSATPTNATTPKATTPETSNNTGEVYHYTCRNGCAGGSGSAVNCANCGSLLVHNQAFHSKPADNSSIPIPYTSSPGTTTQAPKTNAGVWHYTCSNGCAGGADAAGTCGNCGNALAHNQAYHQ